MLDFGPFFKGFRPHSTLKNPIFFRALRARVFLERFPLSIAPKPDFLRASRAFGRKTKVLIFKQFQNRNFKTKVLIFKLFRPNVGPRFLIEGGFKSPFA